MYRAGRPNTVRSTARFSACAGWALDECRTPLTSVEPEVLILGLVLLLIGWLTGIGILTTVGVVLLVVGAVLMLLGSVNRPVLGRRYWY